MARAPAAAIDNPVAGDGLVAGILTGAYGVFSAGVGLKAFARGDTPVVEGRGFGGITRTGIRTPLIAAVEGHALGGGTGTALERS
ncbi:hypothetical protein ACH41H_47730 [Streptomyces sp. NPDC020800]|uniref:hypothetical protein n=1 Tax=Streptomyces sp. NPDC020800 TaxID=3365092 RepID=UPI0037B3BC9B